MEKMEVEKSLEEVKKEETKEAEPVKTEKKTKSAKGTKWIKDEAIGTKQCESCGAVMRGWAFREPFQFCPKCGAMAEKAE